MDVRKWAKETGADNKPDPSAIRALREENARLRSRLTSVGGQGDLIIHAVTEALADYKADPIPPTPKRSGKRETEIAVAHLSDTQFGKVTKTYDSQIAHARVQEFAQRTLRCIEAHRAYATVDEIHVYLGGDMIEGELIFAGQAHLIDQSVLDQAIHTCPDAIAQLVRTFAQDMKRVKVIGVAGNHGRPASKHAGSHPKTNWDRVCYHTARLMVGEDKRVSWDIPDDFYAVNEVLGHGHLIVHGHQIRGGFAGFPFYGVGKKAWGWIDSIPHEWKHLYFGHFHTMTSGVLNGRMYFANGTTESDNDYAREELAASGHPVQRLQFWNREHGLVADRPIYLTHGLRKRR